MFDCTYYEDGKTTDHDPTKIGKRTALYESSKTCSRFGNEFRVTITIIELECRIDGVLYEKEF